jgi:hypothetical protein
VNDVLERSMRISLDVFISGSLCPVAEAKVPAAQAISHCHRRISILARKTPAQPLTNP